MKVLVGLTLIAAWAYVGFESIRFVSENWSMLLLFAAVALVVWDKQRS